MVNYWTLGNTEGPEHKEKNRRMRISRILMDCAYGPLANNITGAAIFTYCSFYFFQL